MPDETRKERRAPQVLATLAGVLAAFLLAAACYVGWQAVHILFPQNVYETALPAVVSDAIDADGVLLHFARIDADLTDAFKAKTSKKTQEELNVQAEKVEKLVQKALKNDKIKVKIEKLKNKKVSSVLTVSEESRRMQDMMKMYGGGMDMSMFGAEGETLVLNANHPLVTYITEHEDDANTEMICEQLYDLAKLQNAPLSPEAMTKFVARSNDIMLLLAKQ